MIRTRILAVALLTFSLFAFAPASTHAAACPTGADKTFLFMGLGDKAFADGILNAGAATGGQVFTYGQAATAFANSGLRAGQTALVIGHSFGANAAIQFANLASSKGVRVKLITADPTTNGNFLKMAPLQALSPAVASAINLVSGWGGATPIAGAQNIPLNGLNHFNVDDLLSKFACLDQSDKECTPVKQECSCGKVMGSHGCTGGNNKYMCECHESIPGGHSVTGKCVAEMICLGQSASGLNGAMSGVTDPSGMLSQFAQQALQQLSGGGGGGGGGAPAPAVPTETASACPGGYYTVSAPSSDPCAQYVPLTSSQIDTGTSNASTLLGTLTDIGSGTGLSQQLQDAFADTSDTPPTLNASPRVGSVPLEVAFSGTIPSCDAGTTYALDTGDGSAVQFDLASDCTFNASYTYELTGAFVAALTDGSDILASTRIVTNTAVGTGNASTTAATSTGSGSVAQITGGQGDA